MAHCQTCTCAPLDGKRARLPQDASKWPASMSQDAVEDAIDKLCGCGGRYACDCVSVFIKACGDAWYAHNSKAA